MRIVRVHRLPAVVMMFAGLFAALAASLVASPSTADATTPGVGWLITSEALPTNFKSIDFTQGVDEVTVAASGGSFTLHFEEGLAAAETAPIPYDATPAEVESALDVLRTVGGEGMSVSVTGGSRASGGETISEYTITLPPEKAKGTQKITANAGALAGGAHSSIVATVTPPSGSSDFYKLVVTNVGAAASRGPVTVTDELPKGVTPLRISHSLSEEGEEASVSCVLATRSCTIESSVGSLRSVVIDVDVKPTSTATATVMNVATVSGGGAPGAAESHASANPLNSTAVQGFEVRDFAFDVASDGGEVDGQAGDHPYSVTSSFDYPVTQDATGQGKVPFEPKDIVVELPLGFVGNPAVLPQCSIAVVAGRNCPADTEIGYTSFSSDNDLDIDKKVNGNISPLYNVTPEDGYPAEFAAVLDEVPVTLFGTVVHRSAGGYALRVLVPGLQRDYFSFSMVTFFGDPAAVNSGGAAAAPFFTTSADCEAGGATAVIHADSWQDPAEGPVDEATGAPDLNAVSFTEPGWVTAEASLPAPTGCGLLAPLFTPSLSMAPSATAEEGSAQADSPAGYTTDLKLPQSNDPTAEDPVFDSVFDETPGTTPVKDVIVSLPAGVSVSPSAANGLQACDAKQEQLESNLPAECPAASKLGSVEVTTPLLGKRDLEEGVGYGTVTGAEPIDGSIYVVQPSAADLALNGNGNGHFPLLIELRSERYGVDIKLPGEGEASEATGQLTVRFDENPQLPVSNLKVDIHGGARAPLANPQECGTYTTDASISSWAKEPGEGETGMPSSNSFEVGGCGASLPFAPGFSAGTASAAAGASSPFTLMFSRNDGEQDLGGIAVQMPPGLLGKIAGVTKCSEAEVQAIEASGTGICTANSEIGGTAVTAGPGANPFTITDGKVFLTGPYGGGPFGLAIVVPAVAGPFNLGEVVVRASIQVNPLTAVLTVVSSTLPQIRDGVPFRLRSATVDIDRAGFMRNATSCARQAVSATIGGEHPLGSTEANKSAAVSSSYAANGCANLPFAPTLTASTQGKASKVDGASLTLKVAQKPGEANIHSVDLQLPKVLPARLTTLQKACTEAQFNANPAGCPAASNIGTATAVTPLLNVPLTGPAYLVSHGGAAFPDVEFVLQGEGVEIVLDGATQIKNGITYSRFETVPDAPISSFETVLPEGPHSILGTNLPARAKYSLCGRSVAMPTIIIGQNGRQLAQRTKVAVAGCAKAKALTRAQKLAKALKKCRQKKNKHKRAACEKQARRRYEARARVKKSKAKKSTIGRTAS